MGKALQQAWTSAQVMNSMVDDANSAASTSRMRLLRAESAGGAAGLTVPANAAEPAAAEPEVAMADEVFTAHEATDVALAVVNLSAQQKSVRLLTAMEPAMRGVFLTGEPHRLVRVMVALLDLAIRSSKVRGDLELRLHIAPPPSAGALASPPAGSSFAPPPGTVVALHVTVEATAVQQLPAEREAGNATSAASTRMLKRGSGVRRMHATAAERAAVLHMCGALVSQMRGRLSAPISASANAWSFYVLVEVAEPAAAASDQRATGAFAHPSMPDLVSTEPALRADGGRGERPSELDERAFVLRTVTNTGISGNFGSGTINSSLSGEHQVAAAKGHVLAVDDNSYNIDVAKNMLQMLGHTVRAPRLRDGRRLLVDVSNRRPSLRSRRLPR